MRCVPRRCARAPSGDANQKPGQPSRGGRFGCAVQPPAEAAGQAHGWGSEEAPPLRNAHAYVAGGAAVVAPTAGGRLAWLGGGGGGIPSPREKGSVSCLKVRVLLSASKDFSFTRFVMPAVNNVTDRFLGSLQGSFCGGHILTCLHRIKCNTPTFHMLHSTLHNYSRAALLAG